MKLSELTLLANDNNNYNNNNHKLTKEANICFGKFFSCAQQEEQKDSSEKRQRNESFQTEANKCFPFSKLVLTATHFTLQKHVDLF